LCKEYYKTSEETLSFGGVFLPKTSQPHGPHYAGYSIPATHRASQGNPLMIGLSRENQGIEGVLQ